MNPMRLFIGLVVMCGLIAGLPQLSAVEYGAEPSSEPSSEAGPASAPAAGAPDIIAQNRVLGDLPVLHSGRVKPLSVAAREVMRAITGQGRFGPVQGDGVTMQVVERHAPVDLLAAWWHNPAAWRDVPLIEVSRRDVQERLGVGRWASIHSLMHGDQERFLNRLRHEERHSEETGQRRRDWSTMHENALQVAHTVPLAAAVLQGYTIDLIPLIKTQEQLDWVMSLDHRHLDNQVLWQARVSEIVTPFATSDRANWRELAAERLVETNIWISVRDAALQPDALLDQWPDPFDILPQARRWGEALQAGAPDTIASTSEELSQRLFELAHIEHLQGQGAGEHYPSESRIRTELLYESSHIFTWTWLAYLIGGILASIAVARQGAARAWTPLLMSGVVITAVGVLLNALGFYMRLSISSWGAVTNFYETFIYVAMVVAILGTGMGLYFRNVWYIISGSIGAALCAMVGEAMPPDMGRDISRLEPVLRSVFWLWVHVKVITASYGAFLIAWLMGLIFLAQAAIKGQAVAAGSAHALYRLLQIGLVLMVAGTILGGVWADAAWGRFWGWDPKEVWALVIILVYLIPLHLRYIGVVGSTGMAAWSVYGFASVVFSWYGVNFLLGAGLHSYGFGEGGQHIVIPASVAVIIVATICLIVIKRRQRRVSPSPAAAPDADVHKDAPPPPPPPSP